MVIVHSHQNTAPSSSSPAMMNGRQSGAPYPDQSDAAALRDPEDESDVEEEAMVDDYKEQVQYEDGFEDDMATGTAFSGSQQDIQAQLQAAVTPLEYGAPLEAKFASYDNYCALFHHVLNSQGPVDLELPSVS